MTLPTLIWASPQWVAPAVGLGAVAAAALLWSYARARTSPRVRLACATLKAVGFAALAVSLLEPLLAGTRPRPGANAFAILADDSQSLRIRDGDDAKARGDWVRDQLSGESPWLTRLGQDFDVRRYAFDSQIRAVAGFADLTFDGTGSALGMSLEALGRRFRGLPIAGVLLVTDGNRTDLADVDWSSLPPIYPVVPPSRGVRRDVGIVGVSTSQTNFESAPVVLRAEVRAVGVRGEPIVAQVVDESGREVERQESTPDRGGKPLGFRFQFRPEHRGVNIYQVRAFAKSDEAAIGSDDPDAQSSEQTLANNGRLVVVDQGAGPYRVLYVGGRPNWEFKFLRRAIADDEQVELVGLLRIARRLPRFDFQASGTRTTSPLYRGFDHPDDDSAERADQPVLVRLGTLDEVELRDGFPKVAEELYRYHAVVIDDVEAGFFTQDQLALLRNFVGVRGGGLLMLGGPDSFAEGKYDRTPVGELLPVYLDRALPAPADREYRLSLTREGWLQPWVRTRATEDDELIRLAGMAPFQTLSRTGPIKPGASILAEVKDPAGEAMPALVAQAFGKGHVAALLIGDLWRWGLRREDPSQDDFDRAWRQTIRWLVGDVPERVDVAVRPKDDATASAGAVEIAVRVRDAEFRPLDNARVALDLAIPGGESLTLDAEPDGREAGFYTATYVPRMPGAYRVGAKAVGPDGSEVGAREAGWAAQPAADEFARLEPDRDFLAMIAAKTGGEVIDGGRLDAFVAGLSSRDVPISEPWTSPLWHHPITFLIALACLTAEWGLRRINGLA